MHHGALAGPVGVAGRTTLGPRGTPRYFRPRAVSRDAAIRVVATTVGRYFTASRMVTPLARSVRGASQAVTSSGRRLPASRSTQPIALRMKNSRSSSIRSARVRNRSSGAPGGSVGARRAARRDGPRSRRRSTSDELGGIGRIGLDDWPEHVARQVVQECPGPRFTRHALDERKVARSAERLSPSRTMAAVRSSWMGGSHSSAATETSSSCSIRGASSRIAARRGSRSRR